MQLTTYKFVWFFFLFWQHISCLKKPVKHFFLVFQVGADKPWHHTMCCKSRTLSFTLPARLSDCGGLHWHTVPSSTSSRPQNQNVAHWVCTVLHHHLLSPCLLLHAGVGVCSFYFPFSTVKRNVSWMSTGIKVFEIPWAWYWGRFLCCSVTCRVSLKHFISRWKVAMNKELLGGERVCYDSLIKLRPVPSCPSFPGDSQGLWGGFSILSMNYSLETA